jgi:hypothetical protein
MARRTSQGPLIRPILGRMYKMGLDLRPQGASEGAAAGEKRLRGVEFLLLLLYYMGVADDDILRGRDER